MNTDKGTHLPSRTFWIHYLIKAMRINIDLPDDIALQYNVKAAEQGTDRKNYIQDLLVLHAGGGFKAKKPSTKRKSK